MERNHGIAEEGAVAREINRRIKQGDPAAEALLIQRYSRGLLFLLKHLSRDSALAEDLHQETFRIALTKIREGQIQQPERLSGFLRGLARNLCRTHFRKQQRRRTDEPLQRATPVADPGADPLNRLLGREKAKSLKAQIARLAPLDRQLLTLHYLEGKDRQAICALLGWTPERFYQSIFRARKRLKKALLESQERPRAA